MIGNYTFRIRGCMMPTIQIVTQSFTPPSKAPDTTGEDLREGSRGRKTIPSTPCVSWYMMRSTELSEPVSEASDRGEIFFFYQGRKFIFTYM